jgi:hypothetical protein
MKDNENKTSVDGSGSSVCSTDDLYQPCVACEGTGKVETESKGEIDCPGCEPIRVMPVGVNARQLERMHNHATLAEVVLHAIIQGHARWEWFRVGDRDSGELCFDGLRYTLEVDSQGLPVLTDHVRWELMRHVG